MDSTEDDGAFFQTFRSEREPQGNIQIPVVQHPVEGDLYVIWTDITDCFPGATRIQYDNVFIPMLRNKRCYRVKPHGIRYHPGIVLDVIYGEQPIRKTKNRSKEKSIGISRDMDIADEKINGAVEPDHRASSASKPTTIQIFNNRKSMAEGMYTNGDAIKPGRSEEKNDAIPIENALPGESLIEMRQQEEPTEDFNNDTSNKDMDGDNEYRSAINDSDDNKKATQDATKQSIVLDHVNQQAETRAKAENATPVGGMVSVKSTEPSTTIAIPPQGPSAAAMAAAGAVIAAADATGTKQELIVAVQVIESALKSESPQRDIPHKRAPRIGPLLVSDLVEHRVKEMIKSRYTWSDQGHSRFFCFLPIIRGPGSATTKTSKTGLASTGSAQSPPTLNYDAKIRPDTKFDFFYICDCGDIPGFENRWFPHWNIKDDEHYIEHHHSRAAAESLSQQQLDLLIPLVGEYVMGVLEILKYGLYIDNVLKVPAQPSPDSQQRLSLAIKYLESKGIMSCEKYMAEAFSDPESVVSEFSLDGLKPIAPLDKDVSRKFESMLVQHRWEKYDEMNPYRTTAGDTRWVCLAHWYDMSPREDWIQAIKFCNDPASPKSKYDTVQGVFSAELNNIQRARDYFQLAMRLTTTPMFRITLNWELSHEEMKEISGLLGQLTAAGVLVRVKSTPNPPSGISDLGFGTPYIHLALAALRNPKINIFRMNQRLREDETEYPIYHERAFVKDSNLSMDGLACFSRSSKDGRIKATLKVTDIDRAAKSVRRLANGLHNFSELCLSIESVWKEVTIKFAAPSPDRPESEIEDTDYNNGDMGVFFEKRLGCDEINYDCYGMADNRFIGFGCLTKVRIGFCLAVDRNKLRDIIKFNRNLKEIDLENITKDDPSQIYESCKSLLANHPTIRSFEIRQRHRNKTPSSFEWKFPNDLTRMRVLITCFEGDKVQAMFQKYASVLECLSVEQLQPSDSAVLEKSLRPKKGPAVLKRFSVMDIHLLDPAVIEDLKKIILRGNFKLTVAGSVLGKRSVPDSELEAEALLEANKKLGRHGGSASANKNYGRNSSSSSSNKTNGNTVANSSSNGNKTNKSNKETLLDDIACATVWADFLMAVRPKLTNLSIWGEGTNLLLKMLDSRMSESIDMPLLTELSISGDWDQSLFECRWMEGILQSKSKEAIAAATAAAAIASSSTNITATTSATVATPTRTGTTLLTRPLRQLNIMDLTVTSDEWERLLKYLDFSHITQLDVRQKNAIKHSTYQSFVEALPSGQINDRCSIAIHDDGTLDGETILAYEEVIRSKACGHNVMIIVNGYHIFT
ncbi:hypothetical protein FBU30_006028 [Linnemannia zychae]|nr:hypothetical protein FBU30_006028 [Linnemannia zychae]